MTSYRYLKNITIVLCVAGFLFGCATSPAPVEDRQAEIPDRYRVVRGDTLIAIAWRYGLNYRDIAEWNRLKSPDLIYAGQWLSLKPPGSDTSQRSTRQSTSSPAASPTPRSQDTAKIPPQAVEVASNKPINSTQRSRHVDDLTWKWPTQGTIVRNYHPNVPGHKGIQIGGKRGQPVQAASTGQVVYSGSGLPGYGRLIIVKHSESLLSAYGYLGKILVNEGDKVQVGQSIAEIGTSNENRPVLHFEIRQHGKPVDPLRFLPS